MRGSDERTGSLFSYVGIEGRLRSDHPLRAIRALTDETLAAMERKLAALYSGFGRPSIAPQMLLRAMLLQAFYSVRSERQLMERMEFDLLFRWFVGLGADEPVWDASTFSKNRDRLLEGDVAARFLAMLMARPRVKRLLSSDHFSVDGTMIQAWSSMKSVKPIKSRQRIRPKFWRRAAATFRRTQRRGGLPRRNAHQRHARLHDRIPRPGCTSKSAGTEAKLAFLGHALMGNRCGLVVDACLTQAERPRRAPRRAGEDREACGLAARDHARGRQGLRHLRLCERAALDERAAARGATPAAARPSMAAPRAIAAMARASASASSSRRRSAG